MDDVNYEPLPKKPKTNEAKCIKCQKFIRKTPGSAIYFENRKAADDFRNSYNLYVESGDSVCHNCRALLRALASQKKAGSSFKQIEDASLQPLEEAIDEIASGESTPILDETSSHTQADHSISNLASSESQSNEISQSTSTENSQQTSEGSVYVPSTTYEVEYVTMPFNRVAISHRFCFICKCQDGIQSVPFEARIQAFVARKIFIPQNNRCCRNHLINKRFYEDEIQKLEIFSNESSIAVAELKKFMDVLSDKADSRLHDQIGNCHISDERIKALTGYTRQDIDQLQSLMTSMRASENRNIFQAVVIFLFKLKTGNSDKCISAIFGLEEKQITEFINSVLKCFRDEVLPKHFGWDAHSREFFLTQTSDVAKRLHNIGDGVLALICDGTYLRHQKSSNNFYQRKSFSGQKKVPLCKPFTICTTNGYVVEEPGPFTANLNDAQILMELLNQPNGLSKLLRKGDIFILDRGFRDVVNELTERGFIILMPSLKKGKETQLGTVEANSSRLVTKLRWVVEAIHGIIGQKNKLLHHQFYNAMLPKAGLYCKIACFLQNLFGKRLNSDAGMVDQIINRINLTKNIERNTLSEEVEKQNWNAKKVPFQQLSSDDLSDFPRMNLADLKILFTGTYQLSQSVSYLAELLQEDNTFSLNYLKAKPNIIKFEVRSRHVNRNNYKAYVDYSPETNSVDGIKRYCCSCANGKRTVGCCSHVAAVIYYLSHARYLSRIVNPAGVLTELFSYENVQPVIEEDTDDDD